jgi:hypothetical protein
MFTTCYIARLSRSGTVSVSILAIVLLAICLPARAQGVPSPSASADGPFTNSSQSVVSPVTSCEERAAHNPDAIGEYKSDVDATQADSAISRMRNGTDRALLVLVAGCLRASKHSTEGLAIVLPIVRMVGPNGLGGESDRSLGFLSWHEYALVLDSMGRKREADHAIATAYRIALQIGRQGEVESDYKRLGKASIERAKAAAAAARIAFAAKAQALRKAAAAADFAARNSLLSRFHGEERTLVAAKGEPCRISTSENSMGWIQIFWYNCIGSGGIGSESYTFMNGRMVDHTTL